MAFSRDDQASHEALTQAVVALRQQLPGARTQTLVARQHAPRLRERTLTCLAGRPTLPRPTAMAGTGSKGIGGKFSAKARWDRV